MSHSVLRHLTVGGCALLAAGASVLGLAGPALAATPGLPKQASAHAFDLGLGGTSVPSETVTAVWHKRGDINSSSTATVVDVPGQGVIVGGVGAATAAAANGISFGCSGVLAKGGTLDIGNGSGCRARNAGAGGVGINLGSVLGALPLGVGSVSLTTSAILATARYTNDGKVAGAGRLDTLTLKVCLPNLLGNPCATAVKVPVRLRGTANEDVLSAVVDAVAQTPALSLVASGLSSALRSAVSLQTNVRDTDPASGNAEVIGLRMTLLTGTGGTTDLAVASAGPATT